MNSWVYAIECIAVPCAVGAVMYLLFEAWDRRRRRTAPDYGLPPIDYYL